MYSEKPSGFWRSFTKSQEDSPPQPKAKEGHQLGLVIPRNFSLTFHKAVGTMGWAEDEGNEQ